jgi:hypothetical protein
LRKADDVQGKTKVDPLFVPIEKCMDAAIWELDRPVAVAKRPREHVHALPAHLCALGNPKVIPSRIVSSIRDTGVESHLI